MRVLRAVMLASVCALTTAGSTYAPLLDVELGGTNMIVASTSTTRHSRAVAPDVAEPTASTTTTVTEPPTTTITEAPTISTLADTTEMAGTTVVEPTVGQDMPADLQVPVSPRP